MLDISTADAARSSHAISKNTNIPVPTVMKILKHLLHAGLVISHRGAYGGYILSRPASKINIADVIQAIEGPIALTSCVETSDEQCSFENFCALQGKWNLLNRAVHSALSDVSLSDMASEINTFSFAPNKRAEFKTNL